MRTIGVCGLGYTGSGAVIDLLREFDDASVREDPEFSLVYTPDGLEDLEYHLVKAPSRYMSSDIAIKRFISYVKGRNNRGSGIRLATNDSFYNLSIEYISSIIQLKWLGYWGHDFVTASFLKKNIQFRIFNSRLTPILGKILKRNLDLPPVRDMYLSVNPDGFYEKSRQYIFKLITAMGVDASKTIVLNQPYAADHPTKSFVFFENPLAIIVDRDPRDLYLLIKRVTLDAGRFIPVKSVQDFVTYYKIIHENQEDVSAEKNVLRIQFEDLIYDYSRTLDDIKGFTGLCQHSRPKMCFKPDVSINNTQLFTKYKEYEQDILYIEDQLKEWLYPFEKYELKPNWKNKVF